MPFHHRLHDNLLIVSNSINSPLHRITSHGSDSGDNYPISPLLSPLLSHISCDSSSSGDGASSSSGSGSGGFGR